ncbi:MAG: type II toxin-antitoxin system MqsA family antitoxin [bacterium]
MECIFCRSNLVPGRVNHIVDLEGHIIIIKEVPANICKQCGEYFLENDIALRLEKVIEELKKNKAEVLIINFQEIAA